MPLVSATADAYGQASLSSSVPVNAAGMEVWLQAAIDGNTSNVIKAWVR